MTAAHAVDFAHIGRTHGSQEEAVARTGLGRQIAGEKEEALGRPPAHERRGNRDLGVGHAW